MTSFLSVDLSFTQGGSYGRMSSLSQSTTPPLAPCQVSALFSCRPSRLAALSVALLTFPVGMAVVGAEFHVAPGGADTNRGDAQEPFASLQAAVQAARSVPASDPRRVVVHDGIYENVSITLNADDSGLTIEAMPGANPILYGGQQLTGWKPDGDRFWSADLPTFPTPPEPAAADGPDATWQIRMLEVDGAMRQRARFPAEGTLTHETTFEVPWMSSTGGGWQRRPTPEELTTLRYQPGDLGDWLEIENAEVTVYHMWDESCVGIASHDPEQQTITLSPPTGHPPGAFGVKRYVLWNLREGMLQPGQWYHDRARNRVVYWPLPGEDMTRVRVVVPTRTVILRMAGTSDRRLTGVTVRGLTLAVTTVPLRAGGFAANAFDGAITMAYASGCRLLQLTVTRVAGHGIAARQGMEDTRVAACEVSACGAGGIYVGGVRTVIHNNHVHGIGLQYPSAIGIYRGGRDSVVSHNEVHDCSYSAINYGGTGNVIEHNLLYDCMKVLHDGAAIYMFAATNCVLRGNFARDIIDRGGYGASAYYLDERSVGCVVEQNLAVRVDWPVHNHMATNNIIRDNVFIVEGDARMTFPRSTGYVLERNVLFATGKIRIENIDAIQTWSDNLFHSGANRIERVRTEQYSARETFEGAPGDTRLGDPLFENWREGDFRYRPGSPARALGLAPIDVRKAGRIGGVGED
jgi:hypothetical protein